MNARTQRHGITADSGASMGGDAAKHKIDEKRANSEAKKSGPVGKAVNGVKSRRPSAPAGSSTV